MALLRFTFVLIVELLEALGVVLVLPLTLLLLLYLFIVRVTVYVWKELCELHLNDLINEYQKIILARDKKQQKPFADLDKHLY